MHRPNYHSPGYGDGGEGGGDLPPHSGASLSGGYFNTQGNSEGNIFHSARGMEDPFAAGVASADGGGEDSNIRVVVRIRPFSSSENKRDDERLVYVMDDNQSVQITNRAGTLKRFTFNEAFDESCDQAQMFNSCGVKELISSALEGYHCTVFAFGQTGSGKTYTITGREEDQQNGNFESDTEGILPRSFGYMYDEIAKMSVENIVVRASYLEVYNEQVKDLLNPGATSLPIRWSSEKGFYVENLFVVECEVQDDMNAVLEEGLRNRAMGSHDLNEHSSRSHSMLTIYLDTVTTDSDDGRAYKKFGKISFVDLAGSERVKESHSSGDTFNETLNINKSLLCLGNCISALGEKKKKSHVPFRDSKLTKLLADSLGGDGVTLMIACVTPSVHNVHDTLNTLRYASRAKRIQNRPAVKTDPQEKFIMSLKREIKLLKSENVYLRQQLQGVGMISPNFSGVMGGRKSNPASPNDLSSHQDGMNYMLQGNKGSRQFQTKQMLQDYIKENEQLREENTDLYNQGMELSKDHENLIKDYEKLSDRVHHLEKIFLSDPNRKELFQHMTNEHASANDAIDRTESNVRLFLAQNTQPDLAESSSQNGTDQHQSKMSNADSGVSSAHNSAPKQRQPIDNEIQEQLLKRQTQPSKLPIREGRLAKVADSHQQLLRSQARYAHDNTDKLVRGGSKAYTQMQHRQKQHEQLGNMQPPKAPHNANSNKGLTKEQVILKHAKEQVVTPTTNSPYSQPQQHLQYNHAPQSAAAVKLLPYQTRIAREETLQKLKGELNQLDGEIEYYNSVTH
eukprot:Nk52_evm40s2630 gene=Nk52_evmTU40s2630